MTFVGVHIIYDLLLPKTSSSLHFSLQKHKEIAELCQLILIVLNSWNAAHVCCQTTKSLPCYLGIVYTAKLWAVLKATTSPTNLHTFFSCSSLFNGMSQVV